MFVEAAIQSPRGRRKAGSTSISSASPSRGWTTRSPSPTSPTSPGAKRPAALWRQRSPVQVMPCQRMTLQKSQQSPRGAKASSGRGPSPRPGTGYELEQAATTASSFATLLSSEEEEEGGEAAEEEEHRLDLAEVQEAKEEDEDVQVWPTPAPKCTSDRNLSGDYDESSLARDDKELKELLQQQSELEKRVAWLQSQRQHLQQKQQQRQPPQQPRQPHRELPTSNPGARPLSPREVTAKRHQQQSRIEAAIPDEHSSQRQGQAPEQSLPMSVSSEPPPVQTPSVPLPFAPVLSQSRGSLTPSQQQALLSQTHSMRRSVTLRQVPQVQAAAASFVASLGATPPQPPPATPSPSQPAQPAQPVIQPIDVKGRFQPVLQSAHSHLVYQPPPRTPSSGQGLAPGQSVQGPLPSNLMPPLCLPIRTYYVSGVRQQPVQSVQSVQPSSAQSPLRQQQQEQQQSQSDDQHRPQQPQQPGPQIQPLQQQAHQESVCQQPLQHPHSQVAQQTHSQHQHQQQQKQHLQPVQPAQPVQAPLRVHQTRNQSQSQSQSDKASPIKASPMKASPNATSAVECQPAVEEFGKTSGQEESREQRQAIVARTLNNVAKAVVAANRLRAAPKRDLARARMQQKERLDAQGRANQFTHAVLRKLDDLCDDLVTMDEEAQQEARLSPRFFSPRSRSLDSRQGAALQPTGLAY